jgi:hypothetical protein
LKLGGMVQRLERALGAIHGNQNPLVHNCLLAGSYSSLQLVEDQISQG